MGKILSLVLAIVLLAGLLPTYIVRAAKVDTPTFQSDIDSVDKRVTSTYHDSLAVEATDFPTEGLNGFLAPTNGVVGADFTGIVMPQARANGFTYSVLFRLIRLYDFVISFSVCCISSPILSTKMAQSVD